MADPWVWGGTDMSGKGKFILYTANDGAVKVEFFYSAISILEHIAEACQ